MRESERLRLGLDARITRRDFVNGVLVGAGAAALGAIVLNRWGHARLIEPPGFHYGVDGKPSPLERVREGYGLVAIGHSELNGAQHWGSALEYGKRAGEKAAGML